MKNIVESVAQGEPAIDTSSVSPAGDSVSGAPAQPGTEFVYQANSPDNQVDSSTQNGRSDLIASKPKPGKSKKKKTSIDEFLYYAYNRKGQRLSFTTIDASEVSLSLKSGDRPLERLRAVVSADVDLRVPRELLMSAEAVSEIPRARDAIFEFVRELMLEHPLFQNAVVQKVLREGGDTTSFREGLATLVEDESATSARKSRDPSVAVKADRSALHKNASRLFATYVSLKNSLSVDEVVGLLFDSVWSIELGVDKAKRELVRAVVEVENPVVVGWIFARARDRVNDARRSQFAAIGQANTATAKVEELRSRLGGMQADLDRVSSEAASLKIQLSQLEQEWAERSRQASIRAAYKLQTLRGRLVQVLEASVDLLQVGITAVGRSADNGQVLLERAESVFDALNDELKELKASDENDTL